jgi:arylsulfatase A
VPLFVSDGFAGKSGAGLFGDVVMELDWSVGQILLALKETGVDESTLVVFTSDNGPWLCYGDHAGSAGPLREGKGTMFEGGYREPCIIRWPGKVPAGTKCTELVTTMDLLPTIASLIGADLPLHKIDGKDFSDLLFGVPGAQSPHEAFYCYYCGELRAVRDHRWKLHLPHSYQTLAGRSGGTGGERVPYQKAQIGLSLFDLTMDVGETTNVADEHPEVVQRLLVAAEHAREMLGDTLTKRTGSEIRPAGTAH